MSNNDQKLSDADAHDNAFKQAKGIKQDVYKKMRDITNEHLEPGKAIDVHTYKKELVSQALSEKSQKEN